MNAKALGLNSVVSLNATRKTKQQQDLRRVEQQSHRLEQMRSGSSRCAAGRPDRCPMKSITSTRRRRPRRSLPCRRRPQRSRRGDSADGERWARRPEGAVRASFDCMAALRQEVGACVVMDERRPGLRRNLAAEEPSHYGPSALSPGFVNGITNYLMRSLPGWCATLSHLSVNVRVGALTASFLSGMGSTDPIRVPRSGDRAGGSAVTARLPAVQKRERSPIAVAPLTPRRDRLALAPPARRASLRRRPRSRRGRRRPPRGGRGGSAAARIRSAQRGARGVKRGSSSSTRPTALSSTMPSTIHMLARVHRVARPRRRRSAPTRST